MRDETLTHSTAWMAVLVTAAILFSFAMACGMPFAALGALAALTMAPRDAAVLAGLGWFANQAIGFGVLGYPLDATTIAWGGVLGLSALTGVGMALLALRVVCVALRLAIQNALRDDNWDTAQPHSRRHPHLLVPRAACDEPPSTACHYLPE